MQLFSLILLVIIIIEFGHFINGQVVGKVDTVTTWNGGGQYSLSFKNNDKTKTACAIKFQLGNAAAITSKWNFEAVSGSSDTFTLASYVKIAPGAESKDAGLNINGNKKPTIKILETKYMVNGVCGGSSSGGGSSGSGSSGGGSSGDGSSQASCMGCLATVNTDGPINAVLNKPFTNSVFTFYGAGGRGACGLDSGIPKLSAACSGQLFKPDGQWKSACRADGQYMLDDPICKGICIKVEYQGKSLTVPCNNKCPECPPTHVDLSIDAFNTLEPRGGVVGKAQGATLTYMKCPSNVPKPC